MQTRGSLFSLLFQSKAEKVAISQIKQVENERRKQIATSTKVFQAAHYPLCFYLAYQLFLSGFEMTVPVVSTFMIASNLVYSAYHTYTYIASLTPSSTATTSAQTAAQAAQSTLTLDPVLKTAQSSNRSLLKRLLLLLPGYLSLAVLTLTTNTSAVTTMFVGSVPMISSLVSELVILVKERTILHPNSGQKIMTNFLFVGLLLGIIGLSMSQQSEKKEIEKLLIDYQAKNQQYHQELMSQQKIPILATTQN